MKEIIASLTATILFIIVVSLQPLVIGLLLLALLAYLLIAVGAGIVQHVWNKHYSKSYRFYDKMPESVGD